jgi:signal peptidase I
MSANDTHLVVFAVSVLVSIALHVASIKWGLNWADVADISYVKAVGFFMLFIIVASITAVCLGVALAVTKTELAESTLYFVNSGVAFVPIVLVVRWIYTLRLAKAAKAVLPYEVVLFSMLLYAELIIRPFVYAGFYVPTNGMAPTLLGEHWEAPCPRCGKPAFGTPLDLLHHAPSVTRGFSDVGVQMICSNEMTSVFVMAEPSVRGGGDRFLVCKLLKPRRWDIIAFRYPGNPSECYAKRVVGMPGERLEIHDGSIWINGQRQEPPAAIRGVRYSPTVDWHGQPFSGPGSVPVTLGSDEYFVIGDFVDKSSDSRFWEQGAPGHPPYAVPASYVVGVVINIYWPPSRWKAFR